ncbi:MAG: insulinase family protein [Alloprevotella sp.]|nr:insulinase family protein [Alloprevotella sp.]
MKQIKFLFVLLATLMLQPAAAQQMPELPIDPAVRVGVLPNGLTYYIRHNALPEKQAFFYIAQKVGSVQEEESQRGLAHFLEHMAFNGSQNFKGNSLISYTERIGVKFGQNLNAYTSTDETVYNIDNVPVTESNIDSCLLILHDWSGYLDLEEDEIQKERGVIHEEWRLRSSAMQRILNRNLETLYPGSRYGKRMPIGLMSVVDNFSPEELRAYYKKWYRPNLQGIVVVGDFDVDMVEGKVKALFSDIPNPENEAPYEFYPVPSTPEAIYVVDKDKEQQQNMILAMFKTEPMPREMRGTMAGLIQNYIINLIEHTLNARLNELAQKPECPFVGAGVGYGTYLLSKTMDAFDVQLVPKPGQDKEALQAVMQEIVRAGRFGITETELLRADDEYLSNLERIYDNREKQRSSFYVPQYYRHFLTGDAIPSIEVEYQTLKAISQQLRQVKQLQPMVSGALAELTAQADSNFVLLAAYTEKDGVTVPTADELKSAVQAAYNADLEAYVDNVKNEPLIANLPKAGKIKKEEAADFGYTKWTLSNGAVVYFKKTDFNESQVLMSAESWGGMNQLNMKDEATRVNTQLADQVRNSTGLGNFKSTELEKALAGKQANVSVSISHASEGLSGNSTPKDLRTLFELTYLHFAAPGDDPEAYQNLITMMRTQMENIEKVPEVAFSDSVTATLYNHDVRVKRIKKADLDLADYATAKQIAAARFQSPSDFTFYFTGNFDVDSLRAFTELYLASLPKGQAEKRQDPKLDFVDGVVTNRFVREMETPKGNIIQLWHGPVAFTAKNAEVVNAFGEILSQRLLKSIREEASIAYSCGASAGASYGFKDEYTLQIYCPVQPAKADSALLLMRQGIEEIAKNGVTEEELGKVKEFELKEYADNQKQNSYWQGLIQNKVNWNVDRRTGRENAIKGVTTADVQAFCRDLLLRQNNCATVVMLPASLEEHD